MATIKYTAQIKTSRYDSNIDYNYSGLEFGARTKTSEPGRILMSHRDMPASMTDGWMGEPLIESSAGIISIQNETLISSGKKAKPSLTGLSVSAINEVRPNTEQYTSLFGEAPVLGVKSIGSRSLASAYIFKRRNGQVSIDREYKYINADIAVGSLGDLDFTEITSDGQDFILFGLREPIPLTEFKGSNATMGINDYLRISSDWTTAPDILGISQESFLQSCDYLGVKDLKVQSWDLRSIDITLKASSFPIYNHVTVLADMEGGISQVGIVYADSVDSNRGKVTFSGEWLKSLDFETFGECKGFYLFYGVVPSVYMDSQGLVVKEEDMLSSDASLSYYGVNTREQEGQVALSENTLTVIRSNKHESINTTLFAPEHYGNLFLEPEKPIVINGELCSPSKRMFINNAGLNKLEFTAPEHLFDLLTPAEFISSGKVQVPSQLNGEVAALYGLFKHEDINRVTLMSAYSPLSGGVISNPVPVADLQAVGFGEGGYSIGGFGSGGLAPYGSTITYVTPTVSVPNEFHEQMAVQIIPERDGYEFILPAWTKFSSIQVSEISNNKVEPFTKWKFTNPDILVLDKETAHASRIYSISFKAIVSPVVSNMNLLDNTFDVIIKENPNTTYQELQGLYLLSGTDFKIKIGYINSLGVRTYFSNEINMSLIVTREYLERVVTGLKSVLF
jgi:hypothetical protein